MIGRGAIIWMFAAMGNRKNDRGVVAVHADAELMDRA
jgi:hypothetical protein